jgi:sugar lactone lactonase YvrE
MNNKPFIAYRTPLVSVVVLLLTAIVIFSTQQISTSLAQSSLYVSTFAGAPQAGFADGPGASARFNAPLGICVDAEDNLIVADFRNARIRRISPQGQVSTIAGGVQGFANGIGGVARFNGPAGVAIDRQGRIIVADYANNAVRMIAANGMVTTIAGNGTYGSANGVGANARFARPTGVIVDDNDNIYVLDSGTNLVRKIDSGRYVSTLAGSYNGYADGQGSAAQFSFSGAAPQLCLDGTGNLIIADFFNSRIRKVTPEGVATTIAGGGEGDGPALQAGFFFATGITRDRNGDYIIADWHNATVRKLTVATNTVTTIAGRTGVEGWQDGPASQAIFTRPGAAAVNSKGEIFVTDYFTHTIRRLGARVAPTPLPSPTVTVTPTPQPTATPTPTPTPQPTATPTPTPQPTVTPTPTPTVTPTPTPTPGGGGGGTPLNVIVNPSFETGNTQGWRLQTWYISAGGAKIVTSSDFVTDGQYGLQFIANGRRLLDACMQELALEPGNYTLSADVTPSIGSVVTLGVQFNGTDQPNSVASSPAGQKTHLVVNFTVVDGTKPVMIYAIGNQSRYVRSNYAVDNFVLVKR